MEMFSTEAALTFTKHVKVVGVFLVNTIIWISLIAWARTRDGDGNGNPLQCSCLENTRDEGALWAAVYGVAQGRTRLK